MAKENVSTVGLGYYLMIFLDLGWSNVGACFYIPKYAVAASYLMSQGC